MSNAISLVGRLGRDAERKSVGDNHVLEFSVANDTGFGDRKVTTWFRVAYWGKSDKIVEYLTKGSQVWVSGEVSLREYQGKEGEKKSSLEIRATAIQLIGGKGDKDAPMTGSPPNPGALPPPAAESGEELPF